MDGRKGVEGRDEREVTVWCLPMSNRLSDKKCDQTDHFELWWYSRSEHILHDVLVLHGGGPVLLGGGGGGLAPSAPVPLVLGAGGGGGALGLVALLAEQRHLGIIFLSAVVDVCGITAAAAA